MYSLSQRESQSHTSLLSCDISTWVLLHCLDNKYKITMQCCLMYIHSNSLKVWSYRLTYKWVSVCSAVILQQWMWCYYDTVHYISMCKNYSIIIILTVGQGTWDHGKDMFQSFWVYLMTIIYLQIIKEHFSSSLTGKTVLECIGIHYLVKTRFHSETSVLIDSKRDVKDQLWNTYNNWR